MFDSFSKNNIFLGVDIGASSIKIAEITVLKNKPILTNYGWASTQQEYSGGKDEAKLEYWEMMMTGVLKKIIRESGINAKNAYVSLPSFGGLITTVEVPQVEDADLEQTVRFEAHKYIPASLEDVVISWEPIGNAADFSEAGQEGPETEAKKMKILLVAASKNKVLSYEKIIKTAGLKLKSLEIESFPLINSLIGNDKGTFILVDIGERICNMILVENGMITLSRNIDAGGAGITQTIAKSVGIEEERAEKMKLSGKNFFATESYMNFPAIELISEEISRIISSFNAKNHSQKIDQIVLSGGTANLAGLDKYLADKFKVPAKRGNPFGRVEYSSELEKILPQISSRFSVCAGLALKGVDQYIKENNNKN